MGATCRPLSQASTDTDTDNGHPCQEDSEIRQWRIHAMTTLNADDNYTSVALLSPLGRHCLSVLPADEQCVDTATRAVIGPKTETHTELGNDNDDNECRRGARTPARCQGASHTSFARLLKRRDDPFKRARAILRRRLSERERIGN